MDYANSWVLHCSTLSPYLPSQVSRCHLYWHVGVDHSVKWVCGWLVLECRQGAGNLLAAMPIPPLGVQSVDAGSYFPWQERGADH
jgi:hypothetical protein